MGAEVYPRRAPSYSRRTNAEREALIGKDLDMTIDTKTTKWIAV
ncbi:hypothetical protein MY7_0071 [Bacillus sp. 5B6]|nr:hypothetical protein MY7_0071 [Bacillus sp. 5B6]